MTDKATRAAARGTPKPAPPARAAAPAPPGADVPVTADSADPPHPPHPATSDGAGPAAEHPAGAVTDPSGEPVTGPADPGGPAAVRILVAEDEALIRMDLTEMLTDAGYEVVGQAGDGQQAVELAEQLRPDLVVMDVKMPRLDGISAAEAIGRARIAPVVMLTAFSQKDLVERARDAGVMAYVVKPFTSSDLTPAIDIARSRWLELHALEAEIADLGERLATRKAVDRAKGVLMSQLKISEAEAFRWIQKTAMDRRLGMREVAEAVITGLPAKA